MTEEFVRELEVERSMKDRFMAGHPESPFVAERIPGFEGLRYFPIDEAFVVKATLERRDPPEEAYLRTSRDGQASMRYVGDLRFRLQGRPLKLRVYHAGEGVGTSVFIPFRDLTSGAESYGAGRYLTLELTPDDDYLLDFNRAFNPYCAYTDAYECGFPPSENDLPVAVTAGEKVWSEARNPRTPSGAVRGLRPRPVVVAGADPPRPRVTVVTKARARSTPRTGRSGRVKRAPRSRPRRTR